MQETAGAITVRVATGRVEVRSVTDSDKAKGRWALVGKSLTVVAIVIGAVSGVVIVYDWVTKDAHLDVRVFAASYKYPPEMPSTDPNSGAQAAESNAGGNKSVSAAKADLSIFDRYQGFIEFDLHNSGGAQARDVAIDLPYAGIAEILSTGSASRPLRFANSIPLGAIAPTDSVTVYAWTSREPGEYEEKEIRVTHSTGVGSIVFLHESDGFWRTLGRGLLGIAEFIGFIALCLVTLAAVSGGLAKLTSRGSSDRRRPRPPPRA
jgi:hypothetical protein